MSVTVEEDMRSLLAAAGVGTTVYTSDWGLHISRLPKSPNRAMAITKSGGVASNPRWSLDFPTVQVMVRGNPSDYVATRNKAQEVKDALLGLPSQDIGTTRWVSVTMLGDINFLGYDETERPMLSMNFSLILEPTPGTNRDPL